MKYPTLSTLMEGKVIDRRVLGLVSKALDKLGKVRLEKVEEHKNGRFRGTVEGEGFVAKAPNQSQISKAEGALEELAFDEFISSGQTVMAAEITVDRQPGPSGQYGFEFVIELDQD
jgi:hypothetical protein